MPIPFTRQRDCGVSHYNSPLLAVFPKKVKEYAVPLETWPTITSGRLNPHIHEYSYNSKLEHASVFEKSGRYFIIYFSAGGGVAPRGCRYDVKISRGPMRRPPPPMAPLTSLVIWAQSQKLRETPIKQSRGLFVLLTKSVFLTPKYSLVKSTDSKGQCEPGLDGFDSGRKTQESCVCTKRQFAVPWRPYAMALPF
ncbi:hypothetical protein EVAR_96615_1 [Eumeta japonica]|uniref:Uncharacterized protein n=1 Tax=Eumeta variegata TaxID=151549 RepID=A0A4C1WUZ9_EUMVA|nr:hypothetical protein EVAR_96615_1 [Eumeta japonica]